MILFIENSRKSKGIFRDRKQISGCLGKYGCTEGWGWGEQENLWGDGYVHHLDFGDGFTDVHRCQNMK